MYYYYIPLCAVPWFFFTSVSDYSRWYDDEKKTDRDDQLSDVGHKLF